MHISVIVPVRDDAARLRRCLQSIRRDAPGNDTTEIIVTDNGSRDDSPQVAAGAGARVLVLPDLRVSALRNSGAGAANGDVLAFVDADHELAAGWMAAAADSMREPTIAAAGALYLDPPGGTWVQQMYGALRGRTKGRHDTEWLGSGNMIVRKEAFERVRGFDVTLEACEDVDLCRRLRSAGFRIVADERLRSIHHGDPPTLRALFRAERWRGRDNVRVSLRGPLTLRDLPSLIMPVVMLGALLGLVAAPVLAAFSKAGALMMAAAAVTLVAALAGARATRIIHNLERRSAVSLARAFTVALVYEVARGIALITRAPHHRASQRPSR